MDATRGSTAITGNARWAMSMTTMSEEEAAKRFAQSGRDGTTQHFDGNLSVFRKNYVQLHNTKMNYAAQQLEEKWLQRGEGGVLWHCMMHQLEGKSKNYSENALEDRLGKRK